MERLNKQKGVSLPMTLVMLTVMLLIGASLYRSVESTGSITTNISLKEAGVLAAEAGINEGAKWIESNSATLKDNNLSEGYFAASPDILLNDTSANNVIDFTGTQTETEDDNVNWNGSGVDYYSAKKLTNKISGYNVAYIIHRMCSKTGKFEANSTIVCSTASGTTTNGSGELAEGSEYGSYKITGATQIAYRITAKAWGPKDTASYVQSKVLLTYE